MRTRRTNAPVDRAIAYLRVSTRKQDLGPEAQRAAITSWARAKGVQVLAWHEDTGISGSTPIDKRPGLLNAFQDLHLRRAGLLVVAKRDRLARSVFVAATVERLAERAGARIVSADGAGNEDGPEAELLRTLMDAFAAYERAMIIARTKAALQAKKRRGEAAGHAPFGFSTDEDGRLLENKAEQRALDRMRELRRARLSLRAIGEQLAKEGHKPRGKRWHVTTLFNLLERKA